MGFIHPRHTRAARRSAICRPDRPAWFVGRVNWRAAASYPIGIVDAGEPGKMRRPHSRRPAPDRRRWPGCSQAPGRACRRACGPTARGCRDRPGRRAPRPRIRRPACRRRGPLPDGLFICASADGVAQAESDPFARARTSVHGSFRGGHETSPMAMTCAKISTPIAPSGLRATPTAVRAKAALGRSRALGLVAEIVPVVLHSSGEIGVSRPRPRPGASSERFGERGGPHSGEPALVIAIHDPEGEGRAERLAAAHPGDDLDAIGL